MSMQRRQREAAEGRRSDENSAPRLRGQIPGLQSLRLELNEYRKGGGATPVTRHVRHVVVERAAALFVIACGESECDGVHDITREVLRELGASAEQFEGEQECQGVRWGATCHRNLRFQAHATYVASEIP
jgi:hypothetical protein